MYCIIAILIVLGATVLLTATFAWLELGRDANLDPEPGELAYPYCPGCGHIYLERAQVPVDRAMATDLCEYCLAEAIEDEDSFESPS